MAIRYDAKNRTFSLEGRNVGYYAYVNAMGLLQELHFGAKLDKGDVSFLISQIGNVLVPDPKDPCKDTHTDNQPLEYGGYGHGDFREPTALIERADGGLVSKFVYKSHKIYDGVPKLDGMPHARNGGQTLAVTIADEFSDTEIVLNYTVWDELDAVVRNAEIVNVGKKPAVIKKGFSFCTNLKNGEYEIMRFHGRWGSERTPETVPLAHGVTRLQSLKGVSSHEMNPMVCVLEKGYTETVGGAFGVQLIYSGSFAITVEPNRFGAVRIQGGVSDTGFAWRLNGGERFITPQAAMCYSDRGLGGLSRAFVDFLREKIVNPKFAYAHRPIVINNWEATFFDFDNQKLFNIIDAAAGTGIDTFVLDDGWFGKRDSDNSGLGDWFVNTKKLEGGLKPVIDRVKKNGLRFGLWFEPEMISEDSDLFRAHPDWAIGKKGVERVQQRYQYVLDFTRKEVVDHVYNVVSKVLSENEISYVKWDMNRHVTECYSEHLGALSQGEFMHRYVLGVYDLAERLTSAFPEIFFEGCSSGGGRFDAGALYYFPQSWTSDNTDALSRTMIQWGTSVGYPLSSMSCHVSACPNHQTGRISPFATRGAVASLGATGYELDLSKLSADEKAAVREQVEKYRKIEDLILCGDLYRLSSPFESNYFCEVVVSKDKKSAYLVGMQLRAIPFDFDSFLKIDGLDDDTVYLIEELGVKASGKALRTVGIPFPRPGESESWIYTLSGQTRVGTARHPSGDL